ncbi:ABC transporter permease [Denitrobaculum tricleocarpae]|uniref:ABC transporter permease subunit n=1 Tax=Denitrobaculum tricleocarpae TaxID=2591009 RepID=A0A545U0W6_9PROT|nr:ABC transporter permease subunit [Denitrobaculum tricleocarpae]TQV83119.1 ABC transporter permease subunit [Denitrobaculum tricleocarpae]
MSGRLLSAVNFILSLGLFLLLWQLAAAWTDSPALPFPATVLETFFLAAGTGELPYHLAVTLARTFVAFLLSMIIGASIGLVMGRSRRVDRFFDSWLILFLNIPALVVIILCYIWFGLTEVAAVLAVSVNKIPNVAATMREGARALERQYMDLALSYRFGAWKTLRHIILPQLSPFFAASARSGLALVWKIVLVVELLGRSNGVGFQLHLFFQLFDVPSILAYTIAFVAVIQMIEIFIFKPWERHANRWRS